MKSGPRGREEGLMMRMVGVVLMAVAMLVGVARGQEAPTRVAVLNFGPAGDVTADCDLVGVHITAKTFKDVVPLLEKDGVKVVVIRVKSGGGYFWEVERLQEVFEKEYRPRFRTVVWIEEAISGAIMSVWGIPELYCLPNGVFGFATCTWGAPPWAHPTTAMIEERMLLMQRISERGGRDPKIMRSMQTLEPLSATIDEAGSVVWRQDVGGVIVVNPKDRVLALDGATAARLKVVRGIAADREELARAMGLEHVEWAGKEASDAVERAMKVADQAYKDAIERLVKYVRLVGSINETQDMPERLAMIEKARTHLAAIEAAVTARPNLGIALMGYVGRELDREFFAVQRQMLRDLAFDETTPAKPLRETAAPATPTAPVLPKKKIYP